jgi:hypothetical protein
MTGSGHIYCSDIAKEHGVPLIGSATTGDVWFLLEFSGRYESKAFEGSTIPEEVKAYLKGIQPEGLKPRILMIQQAESRSREGIHLFVGLTDAQNPRLYQYELQQYEDILKLDLARLAAGGGDPDHVRKEPLFLVCTNGKRDMCCARFGPAVYGELSGTFGDSVWQSSHIGGHNKAPNMLFFPFGVNYGRATPEDAIHLATDFSMGRLELNNLRGRVCYPLPVQAAEHFWRVETGVLELPGMEVVSVEEVGADEWRVAIRGADGSEPRWIGVRREESEQVVQVSCVPGKDRPVVSFHRVR